MLEEFKKLEEVNYEEIKSKLLEPVESEQIKERSIGGMQLRYVNGKYVTDRLIESTNNTYKFEVLNYSVHKSEDKELKLWDKSQNKYVPATDKDGNPIYQHQAPYVIVHGRLTIPGLGSREQFGSSELLGGSSEQSESFKSAATDCLKKCASLFGIALELYEPVAPAPKTETGYQQKKPYQQNANYNKNYKSYEQEVNNKEFKKEDTDKLKALKEKLGIVNNDGLNTYVAEFSGNKSATYTSITPSNIAAFNVHLEKRIGD